MLRTRMARRRCIAPCARGAPRQSNTCWTPEPIQRSKTNRVRQHFIWRFKIRVEVEAERIPQRRHNEKLFKYSLHVELVRMSKMPTANQSLTGPGVIGFEKLLKAQRDPIAVWGGRLFTLIS